MIDILFIFLNFGYFFVNILDIVNNVYVLEIMFSIIVYLKFVLFCNDVYILIKEYNM